MALKVCPLCLGTKKTRGLGMMKTDCPICDGLGKVDAATIAATPITRKAAVPLQRDSLPEDYYERQRAEKRAGLADANFAFKNRTNKVDIDKELQNTPVAITEQRLAEVRLEIKQRDDSIGMPKVKLSAAVEAELKALADAQKEREAAEKKDPDAPDNADELSDEELFGATPEVEDKEVTEVPTIVQPVITKGVQNAKKRSTKQAKAAQG